MLSQKKKFFIVKKEANVRVGKHDFKGNEGTVRKE